MATGPIDFLKWRAVIFFVEAGLLNCINCNPVPCGARNHPDEASEKFASFQTDSGLSWNLEIALSGVSAKVQPLRLIQPCRRCVETSGDVIGGTFTRTPDRRIWDLSPMRLGTGVNDPTPAISGNGAAIAHLPICLLNNDAVLKITITGWWLTAVQLSLIPVSRLLFGRSYSAHRFVSAVA